MCPRFPTSPTSSPVRTASLGHACPRCNFHTPRRSLRWCLRRIHRSTCRHPRRPKLPTRTGRCRAAPSPFPRRTRRIRLLRFPRRLPSTRLRRHRPRHPTHSSRGTCAAVCRNFRTHPGLRSPRRCRYLRRYKPRRSATCLRGRRPAIECRNFHSSRCEPRPARRYNPSERRKPATRPSHNVRRRWRTLLSSSAAPSLRPTDPYRHSPRRPRCRRRRHRRAARRTSLLCKSCHPGRSRECRHLTRRPRLLHRCRRYR
jgi:hypothetical protein